MWRFGGGRRWRPLGEEEPAAAEDGRMRGPRRRRQRQLVEGFGSAGEDDEGARKGLLAVRLGAPGTRRWRNQGP